MSLPTIADPRQSRPKGRPAEPAILATEGLVEAIVVVSDDAREFERIGQLAVQLARACFGRAERIRTSALPEIERGYVAAETCTNARAAA